MILTNEGAQITVEIVIGYIERANQPNLKGIIHILEGITNLNVEEPTPELYQKVINYHHALETQDPASAPNATGAISYLTNLLKEDKLIADSHLLPPINKEKLYAALTAHTFPDPRFPKKPKP